jgi:hypothetical protein
MDTVARAVDVMPRAADVMLRAMDVMPRVMDVMPRAVVRVSAVDVLIPREVVVGSMCPPSPS